MQFNQTEIKDLTAVITMTVEPADYQEAVQKELTQCHLVRAGDKHHRRTWRPNSSCFLLNPVVLSKKESVFPFYG